MTAAPAGCAAWPPGRAPDRRGDGHGRRPRPRTASCARSRSARTTATCCTSTSGGSSASARRAGRCARATRSSGRPACGRCGSRTSRCPTRCGRRSRSRSAWPSCCAASVTGTVVALYPSPAGRHGVRARAHGLGRAVRAPTRSSTASSPTPRRSSSTAPRAEHAVRDRRRSTSAYRLVGLIKSRWEGISGGKAPRRRDRRVLRRPARPGRRCRDRRRAAGRAVAEPRPPPSRCSPCSASSRSRTRAAPTLRFDLHVDGPARARDPHDRALDADPDRPGAPRLRPRDARAAGRAVRAARALGVDDAGVPAGRTSTRSSRASPARRRSRSRCRAPTTSRSRRASTSTRCPTARCRCRSTSTAWSSTAASGDRLQVAQVPWSCTARWRMPVEAWKRVMAALLPRRRLGPAATDDARRARSAARRAEGHHSFDALVAELLAMSRARRARRHAAVGGLRALPLHAGRDEERDADAVRDRLPAGVRRGQPAHVRPRSSCSASRRADGATLARDRALPRGERRGASARRAAPSSRRRRRTFAFGAGARARVDGDRGLRRRSSRVTVAVHNTTRSPTGLDAHRGAARRSLLSTHVVVRCVDGRALHVADRAARGRRRRRS